MHSFKKTILFISASLLLTSNSIAKPNLPPPIADVVKMEKMAGAAGPFTVKDNFPKDYLLIPKSLPFLVGLSLYNPNSSDLELSQKQIDALLNIKKTVMPKMAKIALKVKKLELDIVSELALKHNSVKAEVFYDKVDEIAKLRTELTKAHLNCIVKVKALLTDEQYETLLDYGVVNMF